MISIIILNYNGLKWNEKCISSLLTQTYSDFEIIFVDNHSSDTSVQTVKDRFQDSRIHIIQSNENLGFAGGNNLGIQYVTGEYILLMNNDTWVEEDFLNNFLHTFQKSSLDVLGAREICYEEGIVHKDSETSIHVPIIDFFGHHIYIDTPLNKGDTINTRAFYVSGVCVICKKDFYISTGGLDSDFFMYFEEVDWMWRIHLYGGKIGQATNVFTHHAMAGSTGGNGIKYKVFLWRNQNTLQMLLKNYAWYNLIWTIPIYISINIIEIFAFALFGKFKISYSYIEGWWFNIKYLKRTLKKRREIQKMRIITDRNIMNQMFIGFAKAHNLVRYFQTKK